MKLFLSILASALLFASSSYAEETISEHLEEAIEVEHFIVNWSPSGEQLGRVIAFRCKDCTPESLTFDQDTQLEIDGSLRPISEIGSKADWAGVITVTNQQPDKIIKFSIY